MESNPTQSSFKSDVDRRKFLSTVTAAFGSGLLFTKPLLPRPERKPRGWTVGEVMDLFIRQVPGAPFNNTVDTLKAGDRETPITGIVTTMFATVAVIQKAIDMKANFIIAHEPTYYNHLDDTSWLKNDDVYRYKSGLLRKHNIAVWRNHDYIHSLQQDGVRQGVVAKLGWQKLSPADDSDVFELPAVSLQTLIGQLKEKLGISAVRYIGDPSQLARKILLMPGASGGRNQITTIAAHKPDVVVCGEISEWETAEYIRDARAMGQEVALVVLGHIASEEPGSEFLASWLKKNVTGVTVTHVPAGNSLMFG